MLFCREAVCVSLQDPLYLSTLVACKGLGGCRCSSGKAPRARPVASAGNDVGCVAGEAGAGAMVSGGAVVADERPDARINCATAASAGDSVLVPRVLMDGDVAVVKATPLAGGSSGSATSPGRMS